VQLVSRSEDPLRWVAGVYYFWSEGRYAPSDVFESGPAVNPALPLQEVATTSGQTANSIAGFGQAAAYARTRWSRARVRLMQLSP
jgi:hypothetical protein